MWFVLGRSFIAGFESEPGLDEAEDRHGARSCTEQQRGSIDST